MNAYSLYRETAAEKYDAMRIVRAAGATVANVSGCGTGYYIQIEATAAQASEIDRMIFEARKAATV